MKALLMLETLTYESSSSSRYHGLSVSEVAILADTEAVDLQAEGFLKLRSY